MPSVTGERLAWELRGGDGGARQGQETWRQHRDGEGEMGGGGGGGGMSVIAFSQVTYLVASGSRHQTRSC